MSVASRITSMTEHIQNAYDSIERFGVDTESIDKNLVNLSNTITNEIYDKLPKVSANGSNFSLENAQNGKLDSFGMDGNTEQTTYSGKNLFNIPDGSIVNQGVTVTRNNNVITFSGTATGTYPSTGSFPFTIAPGTYTISSTNNNYDFFLWFRNLNSDLINSVNLHKGTKTITITSNNITALVIGVENLTTGTTYNIETSIQIEKGSSPTSYEPYVGGTPSPNPDYPQDINVVSGNQVVNVSGKNLYNATTSTKQVISLEGVIVSNDNWTTTDYIKVKNNLDYMLSWTPIVSSNNYWQTRISYYDNLKQFISGANLNSYPGTGKYYQAITDIPSNTEYIRVSFTNSVGQNFGRTNVQIEEGSSATSYEPYYTPQNYTIGLGSMELCKIEDYKDVIFKNNQLSEYYDNTLDEDSWYIKKNIGKVVLDTSNITLRSNYTNIEYAEITKPNDFIGKGNYDDYNVYCSHAISDIKNAIQYAWDSTYRIGKITNKATTDNLWLGFSKGTGLDNIKTALNGAVIYYVLATPTYETITDETLISQLEAIETHTGTNIFEVSNENNVLPSLNVKRLKELEKLS